MLLRPVFVLHPTCSVILLIGVVPLETTRLVTEITKSERKQLVFQSKINQNKF